MSEFPWFRFYSETVSDRKMLRVCRDCGQPKALVIGVWAILLSLASESPQRGELLISDDLPLNPDEIRDETGLDVTTFEAIIGGLVAYGLIDTSGECWSICNWDKRQPASDSSTERVRQHRQRKRDNGQVLPGDIVTVSVVASETLPKRYGNVIDKDKDKDKEGETEYQPTAIISVNGGAVNTSPVSFDIIQEHIRHRIAVEPNERAPQYERDWKIPIQQMLAMVGEDIDLTKALIDAAITESRKPKNEDGRPYTIVRPLGLISFYKTQVEARQFVKAAGEDDNLWQRAMRAIAQRDYSDSRLKAAISAVGFDRITRASDHDVTQLKRSLGDEYRRIPTPA